MKGRIWLILTILMLMAGCAPGYYETPVAPGDPDHDLDEIRRPRRNMRGEYGGKNGNGDFLGEGKGFGISWGERG